MCGNEDLFKQSIFEWFPRFFHNHHWVVQGKEIEVFSIWKLISRQGQEHALKEKEKSRQCKCPAGSFPLLPVSWFLPFSGTQDYKLPKLTVGSGT